MAVATGPVFVQSGAASGSASATTLTPAIPARANSHGLLIAHISIGNNDSITTATSGWTKLYQDNNGGSFSSAYFIAPGNSAAPVFTWASATAVGAHVTFFDDPSNPVEQAVVGASSVNSGSGTTADSPSVTTTRNNSVVVALTSVSSNTTFGAVSTWSPDFTASTTPRSLAAFTKPVTTSGGASGAISQTLGTSGTWIQRQIELLLDVLPTGLFAVEVEYAPLAEISDGFKAAEVEFAPLAEISDGFKTAEVEFAPLAQISDGFESVAVEFAALLIPGEEPPIVPPVPQVSKLKAWSFEMDGHEQYVLRLGDTETLVYDLTTGKWAAWDSPDQNTWRAALGVNWLGMERDGYDSGAVTNVVVGDDAFGLLWTLDPTAGLDQNPNAASDDQPFTRVVTGGLPMRGRQSPRCNAVFLTIATGSPVVDNAVINLRISDDFGTTYQDCGDVSVPAGVYSTEIEWRSLGLIRAPGRIFEFTDTGATVRIDGADIRLNSETE